MLCGSSPKWSPTFTTPDVLTNCELAGFEQSLGANREGFGYKLNHLYIVRFYHCTRRKFSPKGPIMCLSNNEYSLWLKRIFLIVIN